MAIHQQPSHSLSRDEGLLKHLVQSFGVGEKLVHHLQNERDQWSKESINIAVIGASRVGKSSHINAHMGLRPGDEGSAKTSATRQCTMQCASYTHPRNSNIVLWDLPGLNTIDFTKENYTTAVGLDRYDFFLILTDSIFTDNDNWLAEQILDRRKRFYLVRTKTDYAIQEGIEIEPHSSVIEVERQLRHSLNGDLIRMAFVESQHKIYLVNNKNKTLFDFPDLEKDICDSEYEPLMQEALLLSMGTLNKKLVESKYSVLDQRRYKVALLSAAGGAVPIPGVSATVDISIITEETLVYFFAFGLDKKSIRNLEQLLGVTDIEPKLSRYMEQNYPLLYAIREETGTGLTDYRTIKMLIPSIAENVTEVFVRQMALTAASEASEMTVKLFIPVIGTGIASAMSYGVTWYQLGLVLSDMRKLAVFASECYTDLQAQRLQAFQAASLS